VEWAVRPIFVWRPRRLGLRCTEFMGQAVDKERLFAILEPPLAAMGFELADIDAHLGRRGLLRLYIDREGGVTVDDCQRVSEQIGALLDVEDPLPGSYVLEVSSPGFDRRLRTLAHFARFSGEQARVELRDARDGQRKFTGRLVGVEGSDVLLEVEGERTRLPFVDIALARLVP
jgi:ribosome maturation factor RimP